MKFHSGTLLPAVIVILAIAAFIGVLAFSMWPTDKELEVQPSVVRTTTNENTNVANMDEETNSGRNERKNEFDATTAKAGDKIGGMTIIKIGGFRGGQASSDNYRIEFNGQVTLTGRVQTIQEEVFTGKQPCVQYLTQESQDLLPKIKDDERTPWFCFSNIDVSLKVFPNGTDFVADIIIDNYVINYWPSEVFNTAEYVSFTPRTKGWRTYTHEDYGFSFNYPNDWKVLKDNLQPKGTDGLRDTNYVRVGKSESEYFEIYADTLGTGAPHADKKINIGKRENTFTIVKEESTNATRDMLGWTEQYDILISQIGSKEHPIFGMYFVAPTKSSTNEAADQLLRNILYSFVFSG